MKHLLPPCLFMAIISSCTSPRFVNAPPAINNPVFTTGGQAKLAAFYSGGDGNSGSGGERKASGFDGQGAISFAKRFFVSGSYSFKNEKDIYQLALFNSQASQFDSATVTYRRYLFEAGAGLFEPLGDRQNVFFKFIAGYGGGVNRMHDAGNAVASPYNRTHKTTQRKFYFQTGFDFLFAKHVVGFIAFKRSYNRYTNIVTNYTAAELNTLSLDGLERTRLGFTEMGFGLSAGFRELPGLRLEGLMNFIVLNNNRQPDGDRYRSRSLNASFGLTYTFSFSKPRGR